MADLTQDDDKLEKSPQDIEVDLSEPEEPDDDETPAAAGEAPTRTEKRRERGITRRELEEERAARVADQARHRAELDGLRREMQVSRAPAAPGENKHEKELQAIEADNQLLMRAYAAEGATLTPERRSDYEKRAMELRRRETRVLNAMDREAEKPSGEQAQGDQVKRYLEGRYPEVMFNKQAHQYAMGETQRLMARGAPFHQSTLDRAMETTRRDFGLGGATQRRDDPATKRKLAGIPSSGGGGGQTPKDEKVLLSIHEQKMADKLYPDIKDDAVRYKKYTREVVIKARAAKSA